MSYLTRYLAGEYEAVWEELLLLGSAVRREPAYSEARAVARATMLRVRENVDMVISRLEAIGYRFGFYPDGEQLEYFHGPRFPPSDESVATIDELEAKAGPLPLSLRAFWEVVGSVELIGCYPDWPEGSDPLVVYPPEGALVEYREWLEIREIDGPEEAGPFFLPVAPDSLHKDNVSGGAPYGFTLPNGAADAVLENEDRRVAFVPYLRVALRSGGFPGLADSANQPPGSLAAGLLPF